MTLLAPLWLALAGAVALGTFVLHLISIQRPPQAPLPTARFVPEGDARAATRASRPADVPLLLMRIAAILLIGLAAARPALRTATSSTARVIVVDQSRSALTAVRDSALAIWRAGDALVLFDSAATTVSGDATAALGQLQAHPVRGALSPAIVAAIRAARIIAPRADSMELVIVSPITVDELDAATSELLAQWRGRVRIARTAPPPPVAATVSLVSSDENDVLRPMVAALNSNASATATAATVRIIRAPPSAADSIAARAGTAIVHWKVAPAAPAVAAGLWAGAATLVAPLSIVDLSSTTASPAAGTPPRVPPLAPTSVGARVVARWADGRPAALEYPLGRGCLRTVGVGVPSAGDVTLQPAFLAVARTLAGLCESASTSDPASDATVRALTGETNGAAPSAATGTGAAPTPVLPDANASVTGWLLALALLVLLAELVVRRALRPRTAESRA